MLASQSLTPANDSFVRQTAKGFGSSSIGGQHPQNTAQMAPIERNAEMADPVTRDELLAHLAAVEARAETRQVALEGKIDRVLDQVVNLTGKVGEAKSAADAATAATIMTRWNLIFLVLGLFAALVALLALGSTILDTAKTLFDMGATAKD